MREDGTVKVLDFGLAKALEGPGASGSADPDQSPTLTAAAATQIGVIIGTAAYMAPEQARGSAVDRRADIWAFGAVVYELLVGKPLFSGQTVSDTLASVLTKETEWTALPAELPPSVRHLLRRCLDRDQKRRLRDIGEARVSLDEAAAAPAQEPAAVAPTVPPPAAWRRVAPWLGGAVVGGALAALAVTSLTMPEAMPVRRFAVTLPSTDVFVTGPGPSFAFSPDGRMLVYVAGRSGEEQIYRRALDELEATPIPNTGGARTPFFSPDGQWVGFVAEGLLQKVSLTGGRPVRLSSAGEVASGASWGPNDTIVFTPRNAGLLRVSSDGGDPEPLTELDSEGGVVDHLWPAITPGGEAVLYTVWSGSLDTAQVGVRALHDDRERILIAGSQPRYTSTGHIIFAREASLWAAPFDLDDLELTGPAVQVLDALLVNTGGGAAQFVHASDGTLAYMTGGTRLTDSTLTWIDREGRTEPLPTRPGIYTSARVSPDGTEVAVTALTGGSASRGIWISDVSRGGLTRLTTDFTVDGHPLWAVDGARVVFGSQRDGSWGLFSQATDGASRAERLLTIEDVAYLRPSGWSADAKTLVFEYASRSGADIGVLAMEGDRGWTPLLASEASEREPHISPDGKWIAYSSNETGQYVIYVERFPELGARQPISTGLGLQPLWSPDGGELFYVGAESALMAVPVEMGETLTAGTPEELFRWPLLSFVALPGRQHDITSSGDRFLLMDAPGISTGASEIIIVEHWFEELERLVPTD